jgi:hypothetical protein
MTRSASFTDVIESARLRFPVAVNAHMMCCELDEYEPIKASFKDTPKADQSILATLVPSFRDGQSPQAQQRNQDFGSKQQSNSKPSGKSIEESLIKSESSEFLIEALSSPAKAKGLVDSPKSFLAGHEELPTSHKADLAKNISKPSQDGKLDYPEEQDLDVLHFESHKPEVPATSKQQTSESLAVLKPSSAASPSNPVMVAWQETKEISELPSEGTDPSLLSHHNLIYDPANPIRAKWLPPLGDFARKKKTKKQRRSHSGEPKHHETKTYLTKIREDQRVKEAKVWRLLADNPESPYAEILWKRIEKTQLGKTISWKKNTGRLVDRLKSTILNYSHSPIRKPLA